MCAGRNYLLLIVLASACLIIIFVNQHATAIEKPGSDPTRPSDSIRTEQPDTVKGEEGNQSSQSAGGKPDLDDPLDLDILTYKVKVTFKFGKSQNVVRGIGTMYIYLLLN
jgi:hypothetical protein